MAYDKYFWIGWGVGFFSGFMAGMIALSMYIAGQI